MNKFLSALCAIVVSLTASAQIPFDVKAPEWTQLARPNNESGINIRKSPSATAARPMVNWRNVDNYECPLKYFAYWSTAAPKRDVEPVMLTEAAPIVGESNGWLELEGIGAKGENGWVSAKLCSRLTPQPISVSELENNPYRRVIRKDQDVYVLTLEPVMEPEVQFSLGKLVGNYIISPYCFNVDNMQGRTTGLIRENENLYFVTLPQNMDEYGNPTLRGVPDSVIDDIISRMEKLDSNIITCKINGEWESFWQ